MQTRLLLIALLSLLSCTRRQVNPLLYRVCWVGQSTGDVYCGSPTLYHQAVEEMSQMRRKSPQIDQFMHIYGSK